MKRRLVWLVPTFALIALLGYAAWSALQVRNDLEAAEAAAQELTTAIEGDDRDQVDAASADLRDATSRAADRTEGPLWSAFTMLPLVGDDAEGVRALTRSLDTVSRDGVGPVVGALELLDRIQRGGRIDLEVVRGLRQPVAQARAAVSEAHAEVEGLDSADYAGPVKGRFEEYVARIADADAALRSAETATEVLPGMLGGEGPRDYLLVFQNNAEIRATGGMPGSWALLHADGGRLSMTRQGTAGNFPEAPQPVLPLTGAEERLFSEKVGTFYQNANYTPDFPRTAELWRAHWQRAFPGTELDGVISLDPVAMSYLLEGTGPVTAGGRTLAADNMVEELLSRPYIELSPEAQDALFAEAARGIFDAVTGELQSPLGFVEGLSRAAEEGRFLVAPFDSGDQDILADSRVLGTLPGDDGETPHVDVAVNDGTGSKMSYYLRYGAEVDATTCRDDRQVLEGSMWLRQTIDVNEAAQLPDSVTGPGRGVRRGEQLVVVTLIAPFAGNIDKVTIDGKKITPTPTELNSRPAVSLYLFLNSTEDPRIHWSMETGAGQTGEIQLGMTPGIVRGDKDDFFTSAC